MTRPVTMLALATATPPHNLDQREALAVASAIMGKDFPGFNRMVTVFANAGVEWRQLARPAKWYRSPRDFAERTESYLVSALDLFVTATTRALTEAGLGAGAIDTIVTASSTGIATPSLEARAMARIGFRSDVVRVPVFGLGCAAGVSGLGLASKLAQAAPGSNVLFVTVELCSLTLRTAKVGKADIISAALFGDGAAACVLRTGDEGIATVTGCAETIWPDTLDVMGWHIEPHGLGVVLNRAVPVFAQSHLRGAMVEMLAPQGLAIEAVDRFICHPGGAKVIEAIEIALSLGEGALDAERETLRLHGNMSAPTILFVLDRLRQQGLPAVSVMTAFGPGFTASTVTLRRAV